MNILDILTIILCVFLAAAALVGVVIFFLAMAWFQVEEAKKEGTACRQK